MVRVARQPRGALHGSSPHRLRDPHDSRAALGANALPESRPRTARSLLFGRRVEAPASGARREGERGVKRPVLQAAIFGGFDGTASLLGVIIFLAFAHPSL